MLKALIKTKYLFILLIINTSCSVFGIQNEESPKFTTLFSQGKIQIRQYSPYIIAKTTISGEFNDASNSGFRILAGYIFGDNVANKKISDNSPSLNTKKIESVKIAMTAPVTMKSINNDTWVMSFSMPSKYQMDTLPKPNDKRISLEIAQQRTYAVITFSGSWNEKRNKEKSERLKLWIISQNQYRIESQPIYAGYNPPWTVPIFKKNEVLIEVSSNTN